MIRTWLARRLRRLARLIEGHRERDVTIVIEGGDLLDLSSPDTARQIRESLEELSGRKVRT